MKVLHTVESYYPSPGGMQEVVKQLSEKLIGLGHDVTVATSSNELRTSEIINGVKIASFNISGNLVRGIKGEAKNYQNFLLSSEFDVMTNFAAQQWATDIALPLLNKIKYKKVFVPTGFSGFYWPEYKEYFEQMKVWMKEYDMNVFLSNNYRDINFARANGINKEAIIPNGASEYEFLSQSDIHIRRKFGISDDAFLVLHVGYYSGIKGHSEALKIFLASYLKNSVLLFIGNNTETFKKKQNYYNSRIYDLFNFKKRKVITTDRLTREETVAAFKSADLFLFPSNIECSPIVLFECMASHTPFLTTDVGNAKEIIAWSDGGLLLPTSIDDKGFSHAGIKGSVQLLNDLYFDKEKREKLSEEGFSAWKNNFTWELIAKKYEKLYQSLLN